jgi:tetratricopeptide (TPR) repeat protein
VTRNWLAGAVDYDASVGIRVQLLGVPSPVVWARDGEPVVLDGASVPVAMFAFIATQRVGTASNRRDLVNGLWGGHVSDETVRQTRHRLNLLLESLGAGCFVDGLTLVADGGDDVGVDYLELVDALRAGDLDTALRLAGMGDGVFEYRDFLGATRQEARHWSWVDPQRNDYRLKVFNALGSYAEELRQSGSGRDQDRLLGIANLERAISLIREQEKLLTVLETDAAGSPDVVVTHAIAEGRRAVTASLKDAHKRVRAWQPAQEPTLLTGRICIVRAADPRDLGVQEAVRGQDATGVTPYVARADIEEQFRVALTSAASGDGPVLVLLTGGAASGKTRLAIEVLRSVSGDSPLLAPAALEDIPSALQLLTQQLVGPQSNSPRAILWLENLERYVGAGSGLTTQVLARLTGTGAVLVATAGGSGIALVAPDRRAEQSVPLLELYDRATVIAVPPRFNESEIAQASKVYSASDLQGITADGVSHFVAGRAVLARYRELAMMDHDAAAVIDAAVAWRLAGQSGPIREQTLYRLWEPQRGGAKPDQVTFDRSVAEALKSTPAGKTARPVAWSAEGYTPHSFLVSARLDEDRWIEPNVWAELVSDLDAEGLFNAGSAAVLSARWNDAEGALERSSELGYTAAAVNLDAARFSAAITSGDADTLEKLEDLARLGAERGNGQQARNLGVWRERDGDVAGAIEAYERGVHLGSASAAFNLGIIYERQGDLGKAVAAYDRSDLEGHAKAPCALGELLSKQGDAKGAEAAYRRSAARGHIPAYGHLGSLLEHRGDIKGAERAFERGALAGDEQAMLMLGRLRDAEFADPDGAEMWFQRSADAGFPMAWFGLGVIRQDRGDRDGAIEMFTRGDNAGDPASSFALGIRLRDQGELGLAEEALRRADDRGDKDAPCALGHLLEGRGELEQAEAAYRRGGERGDVDALANLGKLLADRGDMRGAIAAWLDGARLGDRELADQVVHVLLKAGTPIADVRGLLRKAGVDVV